MVRLRGEPRVVVVQLEHHARPLRQQHGHALGQDPGTRSRRPSAEVAIDPESRSTEARISGQAIPRGNVGRVSLPVDHGEHVMNDLRVARYHIGRGEVTVLAERGLDAEATIEITGARRYREAL